MTGYACSRCNRQWDLRPAVYDISDGGERLLLCRECAGRWLRGKTLPPIQIEEMVSVYDFYVSCSSCRGFAHRRWTNEKTILCLSCICGKTPAPTGFTYKG